jgi:hypothetical protein
MILESPSMCNSHCTCTTRVYQPICTSTGESTFFSPCYAGCTTIDRSTSPIVSIFYKNKACKTLTLSKLTNRASKTVHAFVVLRKIRILVLRRQGIVLKNAIDSLFISLCSLSHLRSLRLQGLEIL